MDPNRKRKVRFVVALGVALLLAVALVYTSFSASSEAKTPSQLLASSSADQSYKLTGKVEPGYKRDGTTTHFRVRDRAGSRSVPVSYSGALPDPFRAGREVIITVRKQGEGWVGEHGSLITKCPSKFTAEESKS
jgi:cytochrome c-type biogenesis protein CcmE